MGKDQTPTRQVSFIHHDRLWLYFPSSIRTLFSAAVRHGILSHTSFPFASYQNIFYFSTLKKAGFCPIALGNLRLSFNITARTWHRRCKTIRWSRFREIITLLVKSPQKTILARRSSVFPAKALNGSLPPLKAAKRHSASYRWRTR